MTLNLGKAFRELSVYYGRKKVIRKNVKKSNSIIYGGEAIKQHIGIYARNTQDIDILTAKPKKEANQLQRRLDKVAGGNFYYSKQSKFHKQTFKIGHIGADRKKGTRDDIWIADLTKPDRRHKVKRMQGIKFVTLPEILKDKRRAIKDPMFRFRHEKDRDDIKRIRFAQSMRRLRL